MARKERKDNSKFRELMQEYGIKTIEDVHDFVKMLTADLYWVKEYANNMTHYPTDKDSFFDMETFKTFLSVTISYIDSKIAVMQAAEKLPPAFRQKFDSLGQQASAPHAAGQ